MNKHEKIISFILYTLLVGTVCYAVGSYRHSNQIVKDEYELKFRLLEKWFKTEASLENANAYKDGWDACMRRFKFNQIEYITRGPDKEMEIWDAVENVDGYIGKLKMKYGNETSR